MNFDKYKPPILSDNRNWREKIPQYDEYFSTINEELESLPKENNIVVDEQLVENTICSVCGSVCSKQLFVKSGFLYVECERCSHVYVKNRLRENKILEDYEESKYEKMTHKIEESAEIKEYTLRLYEKYISLLSDMHYKSGRLIDVGCGAGNFLKYCQKFTDFELSALELNVDMHTSLVEVVGEDRLYTDKIEDVNFKLKSYNVITLWGVLEHLVDPLSVLKKCVHIMKDDGIMLALIPNIYSRAYKILGVNTPTLNPKTHLQMFTKESFEHMCGDAGIEIVQLFCELPVIDLMYEYISYNDYLVEDIVENEESYYYVYLLRKLY